MARLLLVVSVGLAGSLAAVVAVTLGFKFLLATLLLVPGLVVLLCLGSSERIMYVLLAGLAMAIPLNLDVNFLFRPHIGGAPSISLGLSHLCVLGLIGVWLYRYRTGRTSPLLLQERSIVWASLIYMAVGVLSLSNALYPGLVVLEEIRLLSLFVTMLVVMNLRRREHLRAFVFFITVATFVQGGIATAQYLSHSSLGMEIFGAGSIVQLDIGVMISRATGTIGHPNVLGYYLETALALSLALLIVEERLTLRIWYLAAFVVTLSGLLATLSRGAWLSVPVSCGFTLWVLYRRRVFRLSSGVGLSMVGAVMIVLAYLAMPTIEKRFFHDDYSSAATRMPLNYAALSVIAQYPVLGVGLNNFAEVFHDYDTTGYSDIFTKKVVEQYSVSAKPYKHVVHNLILWVWGEVGTVGLLAFLGMFAVAWRAAWRAARRADPWEKAVLVGCVAGMLGHLVHAQVDPGFRISPSASMLLYSMFGVIGAIRLQQRGRPWPVTRAEAGAAAPAAAAHRAALQGAPREAGARAPG